MDRQDTVFVPVKHTCSREEMRFGTCNCWKAANQANENRPFQGGFRMPGGLGWNEQESTRLKEELHRRLNSFTPGQRIRHLRHVMRWSQRRAAVEMGVSRRTLVRHEQGQYGSRWTRVAMWMRLQQLESQHADRFVAYWARNGPLPT
jgi:DNA-binding XRE family transcriptional regulator